MKRPTPASIRLLVISGLGLSLGGLRLAAQDVLKPFQSDGDVPVRRAEAVHPPRALPADPLDDGSGTPAAATPIPRSTPSPKVRRAKAVKPTPEPVVQPARPAPPPAAPEPGDPGEIRISPQVGSKSADQVQIDVADSYYARKMYDMAAPEYQRYIDNYPNGADIQTALFRLAQSYRQNGVVNAARATYESLLERFTNGDFIGPSAYFLAQSYYEDKDYAMALPLYRKASVRLKEPAIINTAKFFTARCDEAIGAKIEARGIYEELAGIKEANLFRDASRMSFALLVKQGGTAPDTREALKQMEGLLKETENPELQAEAAVHAGLWELELGQTEKGAADLKKAMELPSIGRWKELAQLGLVQSYFSAGKYQQVVDTYAEQGTQFSVETKPKLLLMVGEAQRQLHKYPEALAMDEQVARDYPGTPYAKESAYGRLKCLYYSDDPKLPTEIDAYLAANPDVENRDEVVLMKAEGFYKKQNYPAAAPVYEAVSKSLHLSGLLKAEALFKEGWCEMQTRSFDKAIKAFSEFISDYPTHKSMPNALIQRAIAYQAQKNLPAAEKDFDTIIHRYPAAAKERELSLQQVALIRGQQNDNAGMSETFEELLKDYPNSPVAAEAHYWIGTTAYKTKDYKKAVEHLTKARELDKEQYFEKSTFMVMLADSFLEDTEGVARETDLYGKTGKSTVPVEVLRWLVERLEKSESYDSEEKYLEMIVSRPEVQPRDWLSLGDVRLKLQKDAPAEEAFTKYLSSVQEPLTRATGLLQLSKAQIGLKDYDGVSKSVDEAITLQPEGAVNAEAKIIAGDVQMAQGDNEGAAKLYLSVAAILDDEEITPRAMAKAYQALRAAGKDADGKKLLNRLQSRYPEYFQKNKLAIEGSSASHSR